LGQEHGVDEEVFNSEEDINNEIWDLLIKF